MARPVRVLHVDDEPDFAELATEFLERELDRVEVTTATGPKEGMDVLDDDIDCIVSDHDMPGTDGIEFLEAVREQHPEMPFILLTAKGSEAVASDAISAGVTDYFQKDASREQFQLLANRILDAIEHRRSKTNYREIFEKSPDGIVVHDADDGSFVDMNSEFAEMFGYDSTDEFFDAGFEAIHPGDSPYTVEAAVERVQRADRHEPQTLE